ncbi:MAG TPA: hypothetical protein VJ953_09570 [Saprospiraceae bacterium]|nr:hypothetical protein [Saprospiraceae bacterium]
MKNTILCIVLLLSAFSCQSSPPQENLNLGEDLADFENFYHRFHADEDFQRAHIPFPIKGVPDNAANKPDYNENFTWTEENWVINKPIDLQGTQFKRELQAVSDELVIERLVHESGSYGMVRRFAKMDGEWMLIYYQGVNPQ